MRTALATPTPWQRHSRPTDGLHLRPATPGDVVALAALKRAVEARCYASLGTPEALAVRLRERCSAWYLLTRLGEGDLVLLAELAGRPVGLAAASVTTGRRGPQLRLHSTYTNLPGYGVGRALTAARLEAGAALGLRTVVADTLVGADAAARRLESLGLVRTGRTRACPTFPGARLSHWTGDLHTARERVLP
jgi:hypothetical protein